MILPFTPLKTIPLRVSTTNLECHGLCLRHVTVMLVQGVLPMVACLLHTETLALYHFIAFLYCFHDV